MWADQQPKGFPLLDMLVLSLSLPVGSLILDFNQRMNFQTDCFKDQFAPLREEEMRALKKDDELFVAIQGGRTREKMSGKVKARVVGVRHGAGGFKLFYEGYLHRGRCQIGSLLYPEDAGKFFKAKNEDRLALLRDKLPLSQRFK